MKIECNKNDISSFANFEEFQQTHIYINNKIDFENNRYYFKNIILDYMDILKFILLI